MAEKSILLLDICQSRPNGQLEPDFVALQAQGQGCTVLAVHPLDAYPAESLATLFAPEPGEMPLRSVDSNGNEFLASHKKLTPELNAGLRAVLKGPKGDGIAAIIVTCTTDFELNPPSGFKNPPQIVLPGRLLSSAAMTAYDWAAITHATVICPVPEQREPLRKRWQDRLPTHVIVDSATLAPNSALDVCHQLGLRLQQSDCQITIMDCFGYSVAQEKQLEGVGLAVLGVKSLVIKAVKSSVAIV